MPLAARPRRQAASGGDRVGRAEWVFLVFFVLTAAALASQQGPDANWDFRNYHIHNGHAALTGRFGLDLAPAQMQTYLHPALDVLTTLLRQALNERPTVLNAAMAIPHGVAAFLAFRIALLVMPAALPHPRLLAVLAVAFGASGAAGLPTLGTTQSEMVPASFMLAGLLLLVREAVPGEKTQPGKIQ